MVNKLQEVANNYVDAANDLLSLYIKNPTEHCVNYKKLLILTYKIHAYLLNCVKELKKSNFTFCDCDLSIVDENKSTRRGVFCSRVYSMAASFKQHDIFFLRLINTPFTMKQICKLFYSELKKEFNIPDKSAKEVEFIQELLVATWDFAITTQEIPKPLIKVEINVYNFIYCLSFYLMKYLSEYHRTENTNILLNSSMPDCQKDKNSIESSYTTDNYLHNNIDIMSVEDLQKYIDTGNKLNAKNHQGDTVLHLLTQKNKADRKEFDIEKIKLLVENGIDLNIQNSSGKTVLHCEIEGCNNTEIIKLLRDSGIDCNIKDNSNMLPYGLFLEKIKTGLWRNLIIKEVPICVRRPWVIEYTRLRTELAIS